MHKIEKKTQAFTRVNNVIQADKSVMSEACKALVLNGLPQMDIYCQNGTFFVALNFEAERIKKFNVLK